MTTQQTFNCPADSICILNVTSGIDIGDIKGATVNAQTAYSLDVYCEGNLAQCQDFKFNCPINGSCSFYGNAGGRYFQSSKIYAQNSSYLYIETDGKGTFFQTDVYCPTSSIKGGANGKCVIKLHDTGSDSAYPPLRYGEFFAVEGYKDLRLTCTIDNGKWCGWYKIYCGIDYQYSCGVATNQKPYQNGYTETFQKLFMAQMSGIVLYLATDNSVYNEIPQLCTDFTYDPTSSPSFSPTISTINPTTSPSKYPTVDPTVSPSKAPTPDPHPI